MRFQRGFVRNKRGLTWTTCNLSVARLSKKTPPGDLVLNTKAQTPGYFLKCIYIYYQNVQSLVFFYFALLTQGNTR